MGVTVFCTKALCSFSSWEESYHTSSCGVCPVPVLAILHRPSPEFGKKRGKQVLNDEYFAAKSGGDGKVGVGDLSPHNPLISLACGHTGSRSLIHLFAP
jgi:hypothetical protein